MTFKAKLKRRFVGNLLFAHHCNDR